MMRSETVAGKDVLIPQSAEDRMRPDHRRVLNDYIKNFSRMNKKSSFFKFLYRYKLKTSFDRFVEFVNPASPELIVSDENILGQAIKIEKPGVLYPDAVRNLLAVSALLGPNLKNIYLSVRPYPEFLLSYELMREAYFGRGLGFDQLNRWAEADVKGWTPLVESLVRVFPEAKIELWPYGNFRVSDGLSRLTGIDAGKNRDKSARKHINSAPTEEALERLQAKRKSRKKVTKAQVDKILSESGGEKFRVDRVFDESVSRKLTDQYNRELGEFGKISNIEIFTSGSTV
ncbi:hypothetical protein DCO57_08195 [Labrenzia sp. 011]|nr:hypothetical protein DCO57_08195 [Labrenzia sp. 011]